MIESTDFHKTAEFLKDQQEEWHVRTTVNRSYYGVFLYLRDFLGCHEVDIPEPRQKISQHRFVIQCLEKSKTAANKINKHSKKNSNSEDKVDHKMVGKIWFRLKTLFEDRIKADYDLGLKFPPNYSGDSLKRAGTTIQDFTDLSGSPTETLIIDVARRHGEQIKVLAKQN